MVKVYCDICGGLMDPNAIQAMYGDEMPEPLETVIQLSGAKDVCLKCLAKAEKINWAETVRLRWKKRDKKTADKIPAKAHASSPKVTQSLRPAKASAPRPAVNPNESETKAERAAAEGNVSGEEGPRGGASTQTTQAPAPPVKPQPEHKQPAAAPGSHWGEKRRIGDRLRAFREANGLGSLHLVAEKAGVTYDTVAAILNAEKRPIEIWEQIDRGLELAEQQVQKQGGLLRV